ncbi:MAG: transglutaminase domain-containing protein [Lachnospiraceae bacterium]|nr:transglutaminase domain-containing protein [Lachnospiraceae bacterium]
MSKLIKPGEYASFLLMAVLTAVSMSLYTDNFLLNLCCSALLCLVPIAVCMVGNRHLVVCFPIIFGFLAISLYLMNYLSARGQAATGVYFWQWMVSGGDRESLEIQTGSDRFFLAAMYTATISFFGTTVYYFSEGLYRIGFLTMVSLMPFVLFAKAAKEPDGRFLLLVAAASLVLHLVKANEKPKEEPIARSGGGNPAFAAGFAGLGFLALLIAALIPKADHARYQDIFEDLFLGGDTASQVSSDFSSLSDYSGNAENFSSLSNRMLYLVTGDHPLYLKREVFDLYDFEKSRWYSLDRAQKEVDRGAFFSRREKLSLSALSKALRAAAALNQGFEKKYSLTSFIESRPIEDHLFKYTIKSQNFGAAYYPSATRIARLLSPDEKSLHASFQGTFYRTEGVHDKDLIYWLEVHDSEDSLKAWIDSRLTDMPVSRSIEMLREAEGILTENKASSLAGTVTAFLRETEEALLYLEDMNDLQGNIPKAIVRLAEETAGKYNSEIGRAYALETYFRDSGFIYDLGYRPPEKGPEYFLSTSKRGTCSDYATAFVLMARAAGLPSRYTEGFLPGASYGQYGRNTFAVTESDSHAYAEVFISNTGWLIFDPTAGVKNTSGKNKLFSLLNGVHVDLALAFLIARTGSLAVGILLFMQFILPLCLELVFRARLLIQDESKMTPLAYKRLIWKSRKKGFLGEESPTPREFAILIREKGYDMSDFLYRLESLVYGRANESNFKKKALFNAYIAVLKAIAKKRKEP